MKPRRVVNGFAAAGAVVTVGLAGLDTPAAHGQESQQRFEVASIKPFVPSAGLRNNECNGDRFHSNGMNFGNVLRWAYELNLQGSAIGEFLGPASDSLRQQAFEIQGKASAPFTSEAQCREMVRALLADRFKLAFHWEERVAELPELVVAPGGSKLEKMLPTDEGTGIHIVVNGAERITYSPLLAPQDRPKGMTMEELTRWLPTNAPAAVADKTGLEGRYKIDLRYSTQLAVDATDTVADPPLGAALAKLGLRIVTRKGIARIRVLDHIEAPSEN